MKINKIIIAIAFLPLISIAQEAKSQNNPVPVVPVMQDINQSPASKQSFKSPIKPAQKKETQETDKQKQEEKNQDLILEVQYRQFVLFEWFLIFHLLEYRHQHHWQ
jgi:hypothetical protein